MLNSVMRLPSRRTSARADDTTRVGRLELCGFLQLNHRQMSAAGQVSHDERETLAAPPVHGSGRCQGYGVDGRRTNTAKPVLGKLKGRNGLFGHESPLEEYWSTIRPGGG